MMQRADGNCVFLKACRGEPTPYTPIWLMRQAGRYQPEYRQLRKEHSMLEICHSPRLASQVTLLAADQLGVDAAIIFADILLVAEPMGLSLQFASGEGPVIDNPIRQQKDLDRLEEPDITELSYLFEALRLTRDQLPSEVALIGFCGGPFTVASYMIEGGKSRDYVNTKTMMRSDEVTWNGLMDRLVAFEIDYLNAQIDAGADAVQVFDSWAGVLCPDDYRRYVMPHVKALIDGVKGSVPVIHFAQGNSALLPLIRQAGGDVIGVDWRVDLAEAWTLLGQDVGIMGNLDPVTLLSSKEQIRAEAKAILAKAAGRPGHIFNLGHGVLPETPPDNAAALVEAVHELSAR